MSEPIELTDDMTIGGQPSADELRTLAERGTRAVINMRTEEEVSPLSPEEEGATARALGLEYAHVPVSGDVLGAAKLREFSQALDRLPRPVHIHCARGVRAGVFALIHLGKQRGWSAETARERAREAGVPLNGGAMQDFLVHTLSRQEAD